MRFFSAISLSALTLALAASVRPAQAQFVDPAEAATAPGQNDATAAAASALLAQAKYWQAQGQTGQSLDSLRRLLALDPTNTDGLALKVQIELSQGDSVSASQDLATLRQLQPSAPQITQLTRMQTEAANPVDPNSLTAARNSAQAGNYTQAVTLYQQAFHGTSPPTGYGVEYYQTLAGTPGGWSQALAGLSNIVTQNPSDLQAQLAFASVQTYQPSQRETGISRLASLTEFPSISHGAASAWKQALAFLPDTPASVPSYQAYLAKYPNDPTVQNLITAATAVKPVSPTDAEGNDRAQGFQALNAGQLSKAASLFQAALTVNPNDADALGGMGLVRLRQGQTSAARGLLQQAIAANPQGAAQWQSALSGADRGAQYSTAQAMLNAGNYSGAERALHSIIAGGGNTVGAYEMLATAQTQQGDLSGAAASWRVVLANNPNNGQALVALGSILSKQGDQQGAQDLFQQAEANGQTALVQGAQAESLRAQAQAANNPTVALALYRSAVVAAPDDPWARLDLARALKATGDDGQARQQMDQLTSGTPTAADLQAAALFAAEDGRLADAEALVNQLPRSAMTPDMQAIQSRGALSQQIANAVQQGAGNPALTRQLLVTMAAAPDPDGSRGSAIATALVNSGDPEGAQLAIQTAIAANPGANANALLAYAGAMLSAGQDTTAAQMVQNLQGRTGLTSDQQATVASLSDGISIRASDRLASEGRLADAYNQLSPGLAKSPDDPALNTALARLYSDNHQPTQALAINQALLANDPNNLDARDGAVNAAIAAGDMKTANQLVADGQSLQPNEPRVWIMAANLAKAQGDNGVALGDLKTAQNLRQQQLIAQSGGSPQVALAAAAPVQVNPFGQGSTSVAGMSDTGPSILSNGVAGAYGTAAIPPDPMTQQIQGQINDLQQSQMSFAQAGIAVESRSGSSGLDELQNINTPIIGSYSPGGVGTLALTATPTFLLAGTVAGDPSSQSKFGSDALDVSAVPKSQSTAGIGVNASYTLPWLKANVGGTPFGFRTENLVGGVEFDPQLPGGVTLTLGAARSAVTDSLLSYASTTDPTTGQVFGGVLRDRFNGQVAVATGPGYVYAGGGFDQLHGKHTQKNNEIEFGAGAGFPVMKTPISTLSSGVNVIYFSYNHNQDFFTLGNGGYFSPQSYFAVQIPLDYKHQDGNLTWEVGGSAGVQSYNENSQPYFPVDPGLQGELVSAAANSTYLESAYPSKSQSGIVGGASGSFEYRLNTQFVIGGKLNYQRTADFNQTDALLYARYLLGTPAQ